LVPWNARNELQAVTPVVRDGDRDDRESYRYGAQSQRVLKVSVQKTGSGVQTRRVVYLPGLELRSTHRGDAETERLQVMTAGEAGRAQVRVLHWTSGRPDGISNDQVRYSHDNLTGSSGLEVDGDGRVISMEEYYPYGGTAVWTARSAAEADYRTVRHSGKERDATGLYYYGYRYCQPWSGRWLSADPAGTVDGLNLFRMCRNNPVTLKDEEGKWPVNPFSFESKVQSAMKDAVRYMSTALDVLEKNNSDAIASIADSLYGNHSQETLNQWKRNLRQSIVYAQAFDASINLHVFDSQDSPSAAFVNTQEAREYSKYLLTVSRIQNSETDRRTKKIDLAEAEINYRDEKHTKYLHINKFNVKLEMANFGRDYLVTSLIHELSHASSNTNDYVYAAAYKERPNEVAYFTLNALVREEVPREQQLPAYRTSADTGEEMAKWNADTFAHATNLLFSSTHSGRHGQNYRNFLEQKRRGFARPDSRN
ncbi:insecticidal toxin SepC/TccC, partial [Enterobacter genomosp. O]|uniref:RHS repeat-associated core domain-containing protein n=1 Tax=Enterobacter genomosp. O TaxID=2364150 RepID=UPI000643AF11